LTKTFTIVGAGMAGLLAANMLARHRPVVIEAQPSVPNNHSAVLRFKTSIVGDLLGVPFRRVMMIKATSPWKNPVADVMAYSYKNTGERRSDRSITQGTVVAERYIAPKDLIGRMAALIAPIYFNHAFEPSMPGPYISTIPMPMLMTALDYPNRPGFSYTGAINIKATIAQCDTYVSLLVPNPALPFSRLSITGNELCIECPDQPNGINLKVIEYIVDKAADLLGISPFDIEEAEAQSSLYAKINPINEDERKRFLAWASSEHQIYSLGRFATWRPGLLLDDLVQDIRKIDGWIQSDHQYDIKRDK
jgi:hypothetical protein